jgi:hypothetical protein
MHKTFAVIRAVAALTLVLAMAVGLFGTKGLNQASAAQTGPTVCVDADGNQVIVNGPCGPGQVPAPGTGSGLPTVCVLIPGGPQVIVNGPCPDVASVAPSAVESVPASVAPSAVESVPASVAPSAVESVPASVAPSAVESVPASVAPSAVASASSTPEPEDIQVTITGAFQEDCNLAGTYAYYADLVSADATNDIRLAGEGEQTFFVALEDGTVFSEGSTDANGMVTLDAPDDQPYFIYEDGDLADYYGSDLISAGQSANFFVVKYVEDANGCASASASSSAAASAVTSAAASASSESSRPVRESSAATTSTAGTASTGGTSTGGGNATSGSTSTTASSATTLPNTGAGSSDMGGSMTWALVALMAIIGVAAAGFGLRRRNV